MSHRRRTPATLAAFTALLLALACAAGTVVPSATDAAVAGGDGNASGTGGSNPNAVPISPDNGNQTGNANETPAQSPNAAGAGGNASVKAFKPGVAMYYGTGNDDGQDPDLSTLCQDGDIAIIILSFADTIASYSQNQNGNPHLSINGCSGSMNAANPRLQNCSGLAPKVAACQQAGKQVLLSVGGGGAQVGFLSDAEATSYAQLMWDMFLGGNGNLRPFGQTNLDGLDLDVEGGTTKGYAAFVTKLRALMDADTRKPYLITGAPQCPFPDDWLGPDGTNFEGSGTLSGTALGTARAAFDHLFVQFYNNGCGYDNASAFAAAWQHWTGLGTNQPRVWVGLPVVANAIDSSYAQNYVSGPNLVQIVNQVGSDEAFGGFMFWDAGYDADVIAAGKKPMRAYAAEAVANLPAK